MIEPRVLKGFRDYLPEAMIAREQLIATAQRVYRSYGFCPIDTPALEYLEILTGKGSDETDRQLYKFEDHGGRMVGMRFDLTVPLARFAAQHWNELGTPFKRYHIATVWRGENTQHGRYREFMQCDFDTIGTRSVASDVETLLVINDLMQAIGFTRFTIHLNNRMVLNGLLEKLSLAARSTAVLRALDKLAKIGREKVAAEMMATAEATAEQADQVLKLSELSGSNREMLAALEPLLSGSPIGEAGIRRLSEMLASIEGLGLPEGRIKLDVAIARGLDYYTGVVFETFLDEMPKIGSVCSGGRYDNLAGLFTKQELPGVGASLGLDRLLTAMDELKMIAKVRTLAPIFIPYFDPNRLADYLRIAAALRQEGIGVEVFPEPKKLGQQLKYADSRGHSIALIAGEIEFSTKSIQLKNLKKAQSSTVSIADGFGLLV
jgi:histidyl-tRNA synthetase